MGRDVGDNTHPPSPRFLGQGGDQEYGAGQGLRCLPLLAATAVVRRNGRLDCCVQYGSHDSSVLRAIRWIDELLAESCLVESVHTGRTYRAVRRRAYVLIASTAASTQGAQVTAGDGSFKPVFSFPLVPGGLSNASFMRGCMRRCSAE